MIRRWLNAKAYASVRNRQKETTGNSRFGQFEQLEDKRCLAFVGFFDGVTLDLVQTIDNGDVVVDNSGVGGAFRVTDNAASLTFVNPEHVTVTLLSNTANQLNFDINGTHTGDVELHMGDGPRDLIFSGFGIPGIANRIGGDLTVTAGIGPQFVQLAPITIIPIPFETGGSATFDLGDDFDTVYNNENFVIIGGDLNLTGVNLFRYTDFLFPVPLDADLKVGGDLNMDTSNESTESFLLEGGTWHDPDPLVEERSIIRGNFNYTGGDDIDHVDLNLTYIVGDMNIDLGEGIPFFGDPQNVTTTLVLPKPFGPYFEVDGNISIAAGDSNLGNEINLAGYSNGNTANFFMGGLRDEINYSLLGSPLDVAAEMGSGVDTFTLNSNVNTLAIDFGNDLGDTFINNWGFFGFDADYTNFHWYDFFYTAGDNTMIVTQLLDTGDIIIDNNGGPATGIDWQLFTAAGGAASTNPAETLIVNMLSNTGNQVDIDLDNPVIAFLTLNLGDGDRDVNFTGDSNNPLRDINIIADLGEQNVQLSVNAELAVATLSIDLGMGYDTVDDSFNNLVLSEDLVFRGVNLFEHDGILSVGRHVVIDTLAEMEENIFGSNGQLFVAGNFTYAGGDGRDELRLNGAGGTTITLSTMIDLGDNVFGGTQLALLNSPSVFLGGSLTVLSGSPVNPDFFDTHPTASFSGNIFVDLGDGPNTANITGAFSGSDITYNGGDGVDIVTFGTTGNPANFNATLGQGDDIFTLLAGASIASPFVINFGGNNDTFINLYGAFDFDADLLGLNGFNHIYDLTNMKLTSTQVANLGPVIVDNNGPGGALRFTTTSTSIISPISNLEINMLGGLGTQLDLDFDNPFLGDLEVNLNSGPRNLNFIGDSNLIGGSLIVTAGSGDQVVALAVNNELTVGGDASIDLGGDADTITDSGNDITVAGNLTMVGVNTYANGGTLSVGGDFSSNNGGDVAASVFDVGGNLVVAGSFAYLGNDADDLVDLGGGAAVIGGDINVGLAGGNNSAFLYGAFGGTSVTYTGGAGVDHVEYGMTGNPASIFAGLGNGDDTFELVAGAPVTSLTVDFGNDNDTFINGYGPFDFAATLNGLNGFNHTYLPLAASLTSVQVSSTPTVTFDNNGVGGSARVITTATHQFGPVAHLDVSMLNGSGTDLSIDLDSALLGDLTVGLGGGLRTLDFTGLNNSVGGALNITGGSDAQTVNLAENSGLTVGGDASIDLGIGSDTLAINGNSITVGNLDLHNVNNFNNDGVASVGGNLHVDNSAENQNSSIVDSAMINVAGDLTYLGSDLGDSVVLNPATSIGGNIDINAAGGINDAAILGIFGGSTILYNGGSGTDSVVFGTTGAQADVNVKLGAGDDSFVLRAGASISPSSLRVDFGGGGDDTFTSNYGVFDFNARLLDLDGYDAIYDLATGNIDILQVADTGDVVIDNNGASDSIRFGTGSMNEITPANDVRLILQDNTSTNVKADFDNERVGNTVLQLRSGDRDIMLTGDSNTYTGLLRIEASDGLQTIHIALNADLNVDGTLIINGRDGSDRITADNAVNVTGAMLLRGVNDFVNNEGVNVGGDLNMITLLEDENTKLISNTTFIVGGNLTYLGGGGVDAINFKSTGATIGGFTYVDVSTSTDIGSNQRVVMTGGFSTTSLVVDGGNAAGGNFFSTDSATAVAGDVIVNFAPGNSNTTAIFNGTYGGTYGTYRGSAGSDFVVFGASANNMLFAALMGDGNDTFTIGATADLDFLYIDFGGGNDSLDNQLGDPLPFGNNIFNT